eukprot:5248071-Pyramimonas_sp.AAC.1
MNGLHLIPVDPSTLGECERELGDEREGRSLTRSQAKNNTITIVMLFSIWISGTEMNRNAYMPRVCGRGRKRRRGRRTTWALTKAS